MKAINAAKAMDSESVEKLKAFMGKDVCECDGKLVIKPADAAVLGDAVAIVMDAGGSIAPYSMNSKHVAVDVYVDTSALNQIVKIDKIAMTVKVQV